MLNTVSPEPSVAQRQETPFEQHQLVLTHLPDSSRDGAVVPVPGVVVMPGVLTSVVRIRDIKGNIATRVILNDELIAR
jgi:hypothetical protein